MKQHSRFISLVGGIIAFFSFALPWESRYSGLQLANGIGGVITIVFIVSLFFICINIYLIFAKSNSYHLGNTFVFIIGLIGTYGSIVAFSRNREIYINYVTIAFIASLVTIGTSIYMLNRQSPYKSLPTLWVLISSIIGLCSFFILIYGEMLNIVLNNVHIEVIKYGASLSAVGFILSIAGVLETPRRLEKDDPKIEESQSNP